MRVARRHRLASFLLGRAQREDQTALALEKMQAGDPEPARTRARLFREIAAYLDGLPPDEPQDGREP